MTQRVWLITGASRGFGAEISKAVLAAGDKLIATARTMQGLQHLGTNGNLFTAVLDVTDEPQVRDVVQAALAHFGHVDILVNNAGISLLGAVEESSGDEVERLIVPTSSASSMSLGLCCPACDSAVPATSSISLLLLATVPTRGLACIRQRSLPSKALPRRSTSNWRL